MYRLGLHQNTIDRILIQQAGFGLSDDEWWEQEHMVRIRAQTHPSIKMHHS
jgi:hypothetical protein